MRGRYPPHIRLPRLCRARHCGLTKEQASQWPASPVSVPKGVHTHHPSLLSIFPLIWGRRFKVSPLLRAGPRGATPRTRPLMLPFPCWPLAPDWVATPRSLGALVPARSIKSTPLSNPRGGASQGRCLWPAPPSTLGFYIPMLLALELIPLASKGIIPIQDRTGSRPICEYPQLGLPRVAQLILGPARLVSATPPT